MSLQLFKNISRPAPHATPALPQAHDRHLIITIIIIIIQTSTRNKRQLVPYLIGLDGDGHGLLGDRLHEGLRGASNSHTIAAENEKDAILTACYGWRETSTFRHLQRSCNNDET